MMKKRKTPWLMTPRSSASAGSLLRWLLGNRRRKRFLLDGARHAEGRNGGPSPYEERIWRPYYWADLPAVGDVVCWRQLVLLDLYCEPEFAALTERLLGETVFREPADPAEQDAFYEALYNWDSTYKAMVFPLYTEEYLLIGLGSIDPTDQMDMRFIGGRLKRETFLDILPLLKKLDRRRKDKLEICGTALETASSDYFPERVEELCCRIKDCPWLGRPVRVVPRP